MSGVAPCTSGRLMSGPSHHALDEVQIRLLSGGQNVKDGPARGGRLQVHVSAVLCSKGTIRFVDDLWPYKKPTDIEEP